MNICGGPNGISVFNNDHSLGTFTIKKVYWQPRGMPLFSYSDGEHVMQPVKESWENFDPKAFEETVCAGGANGVAANAPEHMLGNGVQTFCRGVDTDKPDEENLADKPPISNPTVESWANYMPESILNEQDQNVAQPQNAVQPQNAPAPAPAANQPVAAEQGAPAVQPEAQVTVPANQPAAVEQPAPAVQQTNNQQVAPVAQQTAQVAPQAQAPAPQQAPAQQINTQPVNQAPQSQIVNNPQAVQESWEGFDSSLLTEAHYDPADYWDEDPNWCYAPRGSKVMDCDEEIMAAERARRSQGYKSRTYKSKSSYAAKESNPDNKIGSSKKFWADAKNGVTNLDAFHSAYDADLKDIVTMNELFDDEGKLASKGTYGKIKKACEDHPDSWGCKALKKLWTLQYTDAGKPKETSAKEEPKEETMTDKISKIIKGLKGGVDGSIDEPLKEIGVEVIQEGYSENPDCIWDDYGCHGPVHEDDQASVKALPYGNYVDSVYVNEDRNQVLFYIYEKDGKYRVLPGQWSYWLD